MFGEIQFSNSFKVNMHNEQTFGLEMDFFYYMYNCIYTVV